MPREIAERVKPPGRDALSGIVAIPSNANGYEHHGRGRGNSQPCLGRQEHTRNIHRGEDVPDSRSGDAMVPHVERALIEMHGRDESDKATPDELRDIAGLEEDTFERR